MPERIDPPQTQTILNSIQRSLLESSVIESLKTIYDPEIPVNIYDLGLIYKVDVDENGFVKVEMTLTSPACPVAESLPGDVEQKVKDTPGVADGRVELVWDPPFTIDRMPEHIRLELGLL